MTLKVTWFNIKGGSVTRSKVIRKSVGACYCGDFTFNFMQSPPTSFPPHTACLPPLLTTPQHTNPPDWDTGILILSASFSSVSVPKLASYRSIVMKNIVCYCQDKDIKDVGLPPAFFNHPPWGNVTARSCGCPSSPMGRSLWQGTEASCKQPATNWGLLPRALGGSCLGDPPGLAKPSNDCVVTET